MVYKEFAGYDSNVSFRFKKIIRVFIHLTIIITIADGRHAYSSTIIIHCPGRMEFEKTNSHTHVKKLSNFLNIHITSADWPAIFPFKNFYSHRIINRKPISVSVFNCRLLPGHAPF